MALTELLLHKAGRVVTKDSIVARLCTWKGGPHIAMRVSDLPDGGAEVSVQDNGAGVRQEELGRLFEPFWRGDRADLRNDLARGWAWRSPARLSKDWRYVDSRDAPGGLLHAFHDPAGGLSRRGLYLPKGPPRNRSPALKPRLLNQPRFISSA